MKKDFDSIRQMAKAMGKEWLPLLEKTLPKIVVHIFPHFAAGESPDVTKSHIYNAVIMLLMLVNA